MLRTYIRRAPVQLRLHHIHAGLATNGLSQACADFGRLQVSGDPRRPNEVRPFVRPKKNPSEPSGDLLIVGALILVWMSRSKKQMGSPEFAYSA